MCVQCIILSLKFQTTLGKGFLKHASCASDYSERHAGFFFVGVVLGVLSSISTSSISLLVSSTFSSSWVWPGPQNGHRGLDDYILKLR